MMDKGLLGFVILVITVSLVSCYQCPDDQHKHLIEPCICAENKILCITDHLFNIRNVFEYLTLTIHWKQRNFAQLVIDAPELTQLDELSFAEINFDEIFLTNAKNLKRIHGHAFGAARGHAKRLVIKDANQLNTSSEYNLFDALSSMNNLASLEIDGLAVEALPDFAFRPLLGNQWDMKNLTIRGDIQRIGNYVIYDPAYHLSYISLGNHISFIASHAFDMRTVAHTELTIDLSHNRLTTDSFEAGVFLNSKRTLVVNLTANSLTHLDEFIFEPFLDLNPMNRLDIKDNLLGCDCRMKWLTKNRDQYQRQVMNAMCTDGRSFWSYTNEELNDCKNNDVLM